ncbi:MAG: hypothetical protein FD177_1195 [Desulfovibrionaceae bacterium]|nr:MAG: hypothetical protein FD177_1195 [Desulfovibrionaceae bacterium]
MADITRPRIEADAPHLGTSPHASERNTRGCHGVTTFSILINDLSQGRVVAVFATLGSENLNADRNIELVQRGFRQSTGFRPPSQSLQVLIRSAKRDLFRCIILLGVKSVSKPTFIKASSTIVNVDTKAKIVRLPSTMAATRTHRPKVTPGVAGDNNSVINKVVHYCRLIHLLKN